MLRWLPIFWACFVLQFLGPSAAQSSGNQTSQNITVSTISPQIVYSPFLCDTATAIINPQQCRGAWRVTPGLDGGPTISTTGPDVQDGDIIPQMFIRLRASALYLTTSLLSNATTNITVSANNAVVTQQFNSSAGLVDILHLTEDVVTMIVLTFVPGLSPSRLDIGSLIITVSGNPPQSSFLPSMTLPPSASLPTYFPPSTSSSSATSSSSSSSATPSRLSAVSNRTKIAEAVGLTVGLGLGLTTVIVLSFCYWRRRRRRSTDVQPMSSRNPTRIRYSFKDRWF